MEVGETRSFRGHNRLIGIDEQPQRAEAGLTGQREQKAQMKIKMSNQTV